MTTLAVPMTVEQFEEANFPENYELHHGVPVAMTLPRFVHRSLQTQMQHLLKEAFPGSKVVVEMTFAVAGTDDERSADVGMTTRERGRLAIKSGALAGAPELVVEVFFPSNTLRALKAFRRLCFDHGTLVFLTVDSEEQSVDVHVKGEKTARTYTLGEEIPLNLWGQTKRISVSAIFADDPL